MNSGSSDSYSHSNMSKNSGPAMVPNADPDIPSTPCRTNIKRTHRKSVSFSLTAQTVLIDSKGNTKVLDVNIHDQSQKAPLSNILNNSCYDKDRASLPSPHQLTNFSPKTAYAGAPSTPFAFPPDLPPSYDMASPSAKKRPFSVLSPRSSPSHNRPRSQSSPDPPFSPPRKRSLSEVSPEQIRSSSLHGWRGDTVYSPPTQKHTRAILQVPTSAPPANFCAEANRRIRNALSCPAFDFSQHVLHRTYVVRNVEFSPSEECVVMLDAAVDSLLPHIYPPLPPRSNDTFVISPAQAKAKGLFAQRTIRDLEVILSERPVVITPYVIGLAVPLPQLYADIFRRLSKDVLDDLVDLLPFASGDDEPLDYEAIMRLNALAIALNVPDERFAELPTHRGVFLRTSRCNHSCGPNAKWEWDRSTFSLVLTAVRQINPGEEITIAYVPPHLPHNVRESTLREMYGFACHCRFCSQAPEQLEKSDAAREWLIDFWRPTSGIPKFEEWCTDHSIPKDMLINAHHDAMHLITREGLHVLDTRSLSSSDAARPQRDIGRHLDHIAMCYGAMEDVDNFRMWIQKALEARENLTSEETLAFKKWLSNPISFPVWGWRQHSSEHRYSGFVMDSTKFMLL